MKYLIATLTWTLVALPTAVSAEPFNADLVCRAPTAELTPHERLRAVSMDLRGMPPSMEEYETVTQTGTVPDNLLEAWLDSPEFREQAVRWHRGLFWNNLENLRIYDRKIELNKTAGDVYWRREHARFYRGGLEKVPCLDEPAQWDAQGNIITSSGVDAYGEPIELEGWVEVSSWFAPDTTLKVCALDAQAALVSAADVDCGTKAGLSEHTCGCGPNLQWCAYKTKDAVLRAMAADVDQRVRRMFLDGRPFTDLLTHTDAWVNGPLSHYLRFHAPLSGGLTLLPLSLPKTQVPALDPLDEGSWVSLPLSSDHSGVLTSPAFLLRFQTNRARANKFYTDLLCEPFVAPPGGLPPSTDNEALEPDLQRRPGCKYCHAALEPAASYWGRWQENGAGFLAKAEFPAFSPACLDCATGTPCTTNCSSYITSALDPSEEEWFGYLKAFLFRRADHMDHVDLGPNALVVRSLVDHRLPTCVTQRVAAWLLGRGFYPEEKAWLATVAQDWVQQGFQFEWLVRAIVASDMYGMVR